MGLWGRLLYNDLSQKTKKRCRVPPLSDDVSQATHSNGNLFWKSPQAIYRNTVLLSWAQAKYGFFAGYLQTIANPGFNSLVTTAGAYSEG